MRDEKARVLQAVRPLDDAHVVRGQYAGYRDEAEVAADSLVETYAALRLEIDSPRWAGVPFLVRAGKRLPVTATEVMVRLRAPSHGCLPSPRARRITCAFGSAGPRIDRRWACSPRSRARKCVAATSELLMCDEEAGQSGPTSA